MRDFEKEAYDKLAELEDDIQRKNGRIINAIRSVKGSGFVINLLELVDEISDYTVYESWTLVKKPVGDKQEEDFGLIEYVWCDQWSTGMEDDSFSGYIYVELKEHLFLKIPYSC